MYHCIINKLKIELTMYSFFELVEQKQNSELKKFKDEILKATNAANPTWYSWLQNKKVSTANQIIISSHLNTPREMLFPD